MKKRVTVAMICALIAGSLTLTMLCACSVFVGWSMQAAATAGITKAVEESKKPGNEFAALAAAPLAMGYPLGFGMMWAGILPPFFIWPMTWLTCLALHRLGWPEKRALDNDVRAPVSLPRAATTAIAAAVLLVATSRAIAKDRVDYPIRGVLGIETVTLTPGLEDVVGAPSRPGAWVTSPPASAGDPPAHGHNDVLWPPIQAGDLIVGIDGQGIWSAEDLDAFLADKVVGDVVRVDTVRKGRPRTVSVKLKQADPVVYLPARTCAIPTTGTIVGVNFAPILLFGLQATARGGSELAGQCPVPLDACVQLRLIQQTREGTIVEMNGARFEIDGNWTGHTHLQQAGCKDEQKRIADEAAARNREKEAAIAERSNR